MGLSMIAEYLHFPLKTAESMHRYSRNLAPYHIAGHLPIFTTHNFLQCVRKVIVHLGCGLRYLDGALLNRGHHFQQLL
jgi:hypothetical protein